MSIKRFCIWAGRYLPACSFLLILSCMVSLGAQTVDRHKVGIAYLHAAQTELNLVHIPAALSQIQKGLDVDPKFSDLWLLRSRIRTNNFSDIRGALVDARAALSYHNWVEFRQNEGLTQLITVLTVMHRWNEAAQELKTQITDQDLLVFPVLLAQKCRILFEIGEIDKASTLLKAALSRHPDNFGLMEIATQYRLIPPATAFIWFNRFRSTAPEYVQALFWYFHHLEPGVESLKRCQDYLELGGKDPFVFVDALKAAQTDPAYDSVVEMKWLEAFLAQTTPIDLDVAFCMDALLKDSNSKKRLATVLASPRLHALRDLDRDGYPEEYVDFQDGHIVSWKVDNDQSGLTELTLLFRDGLPYRADQQADTQVIRLDFASYPEVATVWIRSADKIIEFVMPHRSEELRLIDIPEGGFVDPLQTLQYLKINPQRLFFDPIKLGAAAWLENEYQSENSSNHRIYRQTRFEQGKAIVQRIDTNNDGHFDSFYWFDNGEKRIGFRDVQDDGSFSVIEYYDHGKPSEYKFVSGEDGTSFSIRPSAGSVKWDLNHDNRLDFQEIRAANAWIEDAFSARVDDNFDPIAMTKRYGKAWNN